MNTKINWNKVFNFGLVLFTVLGSLFTSLKIPQYGLIFNLISQIFWIYSSYKAWKKADQPGIFINTLIITMVVLYGIINYWFLG